MRNYHKKSSVSLKTILLGLLLSLNLSHVSAGDVLPLAVDLQKAGQSAAKKNVPVVIFATATWCNYCKKLEQNILYPLLQTTDLEEYGHFSQLVLDKDHWMMKDFQGRDIEMKTLGPKLGVKVAPTTLIFDSQGNQIADPIIGLTLEEFYPGNLERAINQALEKLGNPKRVDIYKMVEESKVDYQPQ
ncbi:MULTISPECIES: thioredoxin fold domain-containing protein [Thiomicrorhabdus]|uniref:Thioredoxin fold domain-containing protein n=1 Tax=Thiomicrorhabdus xiamenensis TaxID=2739063 RepID=A0A7D4SIR4_9GAMM|nr:MULTISPECIES: thioredoxin fold domain-containing protein [Thiomicrorhabdus]MBO1923128.1 thioredoxin fold domain-containing protein [Thiomicrorhabdus sp. 6S3-12]QKI89900.1 thioredoxin fold domain-containing protein [Thiomicrorhabdus xiamenensis]